MTEIRVPAAARLKDGDKKIISVRKTKLLFIRHAGTIIAVQPTCPHAGGPLEKGAVCNGRLVCPWHMGTFALPTGTLLEPPAMDSLKTYAVRVDGNKVFVDLTPQEGIERQGTRSRKARDGRTFLLIGGGAANAMAATILRKEGFAGKIVVVDPVADEPIDRTQLSKQPLSDKTPLAKTRLHTFDELKVERVIASVVAFNSKRKEVRLNNGKVIKFDAAVIATGGVPKRLEIPGADDVYTIRHSEDVRRIRAKARKDSQAVIVGTSFIGLEAASALVQRGVKVTVVGKDKLPFAKQFGDRVAKILLALHRRKGVKFRLGVKIVALSARRVTVEKSGKQKEISGDFVLMGVGVSPNLQFEHDLALAEDGGIATDESLQVADQVWVAGDIASVRGRRIEHWRLAQQHGMTAARQMMGSKNGFYSVPFFWTFHFGKRLDYLGHADDWDEIVFDGNVKNLDFLAFYMKDSQVAAVLSCGREHDTAMLAEIMREKLSRTCRDLR